MDISPYYYHYESITIEIIAKIIYFKTYKCAAIHPTHIHVYYIIMYNYYVIVHLGKYRKVACVNDGDSP